MSTVEYNNQNLGRKSNFFIKHGISEFIELFFYLIVTVILVYFVDYRLNKIIFLVVLPIVWYTKRDYFWIAFFFVLLEEPGNLISGGLRDDPYRLPIYSLAPGVSFALHELFILLIFIKSISVKRIGRNYNPLLLRRELKILLWLFISLILISPLLGISIDSISKVFKLSIGFTLFYSLPRLVINEEQFTNLIKLLFPFVFVALALQAFYLINGKQLSILFVPAVLNEKTDNTLLNSEIWQRPIELVHAMLITFTGSFYLLISKRFKISKFYLILINLLSFLVILMSGTRSWIIAFLAGYLIFFVFTVRRTSRLLANAFIIIFVVFFAFRGIPVLSKQIKSSLNRMTTMEKIFEGDITGGGTISRFDVRAPKVIKAFMSSTIILGAGFSEYFFENADGHVGYHNILFNSGIAGLLLFIYVVWRILSLPFKITKQRNKSVKWNIRISIIPLVILLIINIGTQTLGFTPDGVNRIVLMVYSLIMIDLAVRTYISGPTQ